MAIGVATRAAPAYAGHTLTEVQLVQPALLATTRWRGISLAGTLNAEGYSLRRGELNPGMLGEGYIDRRHPHTLIHEAMLIMETPGWHPGNSRARLSASVAAGRGFVPFGSDDPMMRPLEKYPVNHHHAQIIERLQAITALNLSNGSRSATVELTRFGGDEPAGPFHGPRWNRFGDSWAVRTTVQPIAGVEIAASRASIRSPELQQSGGFDHTGSHAGLRVDHPLVDGNTRYLLVEWARTDDIANRRRAFTYQSALVEGALGFRGALVAARLERTDRGEQARLADPFRAAVGHVDFQIPGITRWTIATAALQAPPRYAKQLSVLHIQPFVEVALAVPVPTNRPTAFEPAAFYGGSRIWSASLGVRMHAGMMRARMGRYGVVGIPHPNGAAPHAM